MTPRSQLENRIAARLAILSDADMQRVAEDYARLRFPERFPRFDFRAFSAEGKSRPGWPDAWIALPDGRIDGVEATGSKDKSKVLYHLREDLEKASKHDPKLAGFMLVSGNPAVQLTGQELKALRQRFIDEAGIDSDRIDLVFGGRLVQELAGPEFARTRSEVLQLLNRPYYFKLVRADLPPDESRLNSDFIPSPEDYASGRVHRPEVTDTVLAYLEHDGRVLVRGIGASGKSVMAWLLALEAANRRRPAYYLDLAPIVDSDIKISNLLAEDLQDFGHPDTLFVLDNIHLDESLAKQVALDWADLTPTQRPRLLLLGRELQTGRGSPIAGLAIPTLTLKARQAEVLGVYRRLAWRRSGDTVSPEPLADDLDRWVATFGGDPASPETTTDLIAFSAAVLRRLPRLLLHDWTLSEEDAIDEIREVYLDELSDGETHNLMRLCVLSELELSLPEDALANLRADFKRAGRRLGLVFKETIGFSQKRVHFRLAHAALSKLILTAAHERVDCAAERRIVALAHPFLGFKLCTRLHNNGATGEARKVVSELLLEPRRLLELGQLHHAHISIRLAQQRLNITLSSDLGQRLAEADNRRLLLEKALLTPLYFLANFLAYAAKTTELKPVFKALTEDLAKPENLRKLTTELARQPLDAVVSVLSSDVAIDLWNTVFTDIDEADWEEARHTEESPSIHAYTTFQRIALQKGRPEFAEAPSMRLVIGSTQKDWHQPVIGVHHLSHVVRFAQRRVSSTEIECFLERVATADWLDEQYKAASTGGLAGALNSLTTALEPTQCRRFLRETLLQRVGRELSCRRMYNTESRAQALSLLGSAATAGVWNPETDYDWPNAKELAEVLELRAPDPDHATINHLQTQLWLGLREMARLRTDPVMVPPRLADRILNLWVATQEGEAGTALAPHLCDRNTAMITWLHAMITWLQRCKTAGWCLVPPQVVPVTRDA